jgi:DNA repair exonuclease SbcCD ATPase subunit
MKTFLVSIFITLVCSFVYAQMETDPAPNTAEWQLTLDVIKNKSMALMEQNAKLMDEYNSLQGSYKVSRMERRDWELKNEALRQILKKRHGRSEQQTRIDDLNNQIKDKVGSIKELQKALNNVQKDLAESEQRLKLRKLKASEVTLHVKLAASQEKSISLLDARAALQHDEELEKARAKLQEARAKEEDLQNQVDQLKQQAMPPASDEGQIKELQAQLESLQKQKDDLQNRANVDNNQRYLQLMTKKKELEDKIKEFEAQLAQLKEPATFGLIDPKQKKQIIRQMAQIDSRNIQLRQKLADLKQDVNLLKEQVGHLEHQAKGIEEVSNTK